MMGLGDELWNGEREGIWAGFEPSNKIDKLNCFQLVTVDNSLATVEFVVCPTFPFLTPVIRIKCF
jgi:hypothetical protein